MFTQIPQNCLRINNPQDASSIQNFYFFTKLYMFRTSTVPIIRSYQLITPDEGHSKCPKHVEFRDKIKILDTWRILLVIYTKIITMHGHLNIKYRKINFQSSRNPLRPRIFQKPSDSYNLICVFLAMFITTVTHKTLKLMLSVIRQEHERFIQKWPLVSVETLVMHVTCSTWKARVLLEADAWKYECRFTCCEQNSEENSNVKIYKKPQKSNKGRKLGNDMEMKSTKKLTAYWIRSKTAILWSRNLVLSFRCLHSGVIQACFAITLPHKPSGCQVAKTSGRTLPTLQKNLPPPSCGCVITYFTKILNFAALKSPDYCRSS
jgi:hypothetical protein